MCVLLDHGTVMAVAEFSKVYSCIIILVEFQEITECLKLILRQEVL